ncbi:MAG: elongation factor G, partial [Clostridia bacterium]
MAEFLAKDIRNIALIGHSGEGKTTLAEALLFTAKAIDRQGRTDDGNTTMDFDPEEIAKRISISLATGNCVYKDIKINIIDVPGYFDFEGEMVEALSVADSAIIVTGSSGNCSVGTEKALDYCMEHNIPATLFINGLDKDNCNYWGTVDAIAEKYPNKIAPVFIPYMLEGKLAGYVNVLLGEYYAVGTHGKSGQPFPEEIKARYDEARAKVIEAAAENDDDLMMKFFDGEELTREEILFGMNKGLKAGKCIPALAGSALTDKGIHNLLQHITDTLPSPADDKVEAKDSEGNAMEIDCVDKAPVVLQVFKTIADPFVGKLSLFKVVSGTLKSGLSLHNTSKECDEKISSIYFLRGKKQEPTDCVHAGDIGALSKLSNTSTGDTLCEGKVVMLPEIKMPRPVLSMAVYAAKKGDEDKIFAGLSKLKDEDIAFTVTKDPETKEMLLSGVGEAQLDVLCRKLKNKYSCEAVLKEPRIAYRETIKKSIEAEGKHKKQSGGAGQYGHCKVRFEPGAADGQFEFVDAVVGGAVPKQYIP